MDEHEIRDDHEGHGIVLLSVFRDVLDWIVRDIRNPDLEIYRRDDRPHFQWNSFAVPIPLDACVSPGEKSCRDFFANLLSPKLTSGSPLARDHIVVTAGCTGAMNITLCTILDPTDKVLLIAPHLPHYTAWIRNYSLSDPVILQTRPERNWEPDPADLEAALTDSDIRAVILNSPNYITGSVYSEETLSGIGRVLRRAISRNPLGRPIWLISDSSLVNLVEDHPPLFDYYRYTIACYSISHDYGLRGLRIGCAVANLGIEHCSEVVKRLSRANDALGFCGGHRATQHILSHLGKLIAEKREIPEGSRESLAAAHNRLCEALGVRPSEGKLNHGCAFVRDPPAQEELAPKLKARGLELVAWVSARALGCCQELENYVQIAARTIRSSSEGNEEKQIEEEEEDRDG